MLQTLYVRRYLLWVVVLGLLMWTTGTAIASSPVQITVNDPSPDRVEITIDFPEPSHQIVRTAQGSQDRWWFPDEQSFTIPGQPVLPVISRLVQVADMGDIEANIIYIEEDEYPAAQYGPVRAPIDEFVYDPEPDDAAVFPHWIVQVSEPMIAGGIRLASLSISPVRYDSERNVYHVIRRVQVSVDNMGGTGANPLTHRRPIAPAFAEMFKEMVVNWVDDANPVHHGDLRSRYLIIALDSFIGTTSNIEALVEWKEQKGYEVLLVSKTEAGSSSNNIKSYIQGVYESEGPPLAFVLLAGDANVPNDIPTFTIESPTHPGEWDVSDTPYSLMEGDDYLPDLFVGRLSTSGINNLRVIISKILKYEKTPYTGNTEWFRNATIVAGNYTDQPLVPLTPVQTSIWIHDKFESNGFTRVDTLFYWGPGHTPPSTAAISQSINQGVSWVSYRGYADIEGWQYPDFRIGDVGSLNNYMRTPIVTSFVCRTGDFGNDTNPGFGETWLVAGQVNNVIGGVAFIGASDLYTNTRFNNALAAGFYSGVFDDGLQHLGQALLRGKMELYNGFPAGREIGESCEFYFYVYNIIGDPELSMRTRIPTTLDADHPSTMNVGESFAEITSRNSGGDIVRYAEVTLFKEDETHVNANTGSTGTIMLPVNLETTGTLSLTVHTQDCVPYTADITVESPSTYAGLSSLTYSAGGDDIVSPGENVDLIVSLINSGSTNLSNVSATLTTDDAYITLGTTSYNYGSINSGATSSNSTPFTFTVADEATHNHQAMMTLTVSAQQGGPWTHHFWVPIWGPYLRVDDVQISGNGILDPGETADITFMLYNEGMDDIPSFQAELSSWNNAITFPTPTANFPSIAVNASASNSNALHISAPSDITPGRLAELELAITVNSETVQVIRTAITVGEADTSDPLGPDAYGYWVYDSDDQSYSEHPDYNWIEIAGTGQGHLLEDDQSVAVDLPANFNFQYYGQTYDEITICSNGWISFGDTWMANFRNWHLPSALGPPALIAGFWDDIRGHPDGNNDPLPREVWTQFDETNHRFIIEWDEWYNKYDYSIYVYHEATFEIILLDPDYYPTATGDGEIIIQYEVAENVDANSNYATVGIENGPHTIGLQYTFANLYPPSCSHLRSGLAVKFTTNAPDIYVNAEEPPAPLPDQIALLPGYPNPFNSQAVFPLELSEQTSVQISVFNVLGQKMVDLRNQVMEPGRHQIAWNAGELPSGIYFVTLQAGSINQVHKIVLLK